jgi:uncharacterized protein YbjT (DUF2867 family)
MTGDLSAPAGDSVPPADPGPADATITASRRKVAVVGAGGFVGTNLVPRLVADGFHVHALLRDASGFHSRDNVEVHVTDVSDRQDVARALAGCDVAYYLVHAMAGGEGFAERDRALALSFAGAAATAGVGRIVYLGGLGHEGLSTHLASRQEVGGLLGSTGVPVVELRAAVVLGAGSISFEMVRYLTERLPMMVCPRWVNTPTQPIALADLLAYLVESADVAPGIYEVGCTDATTYRQMMDTYARVRGLRPRLVVKVPVLTPALSAHWVDLVTPVDAIVSHALIESLTNEVTVRTRAHTDAAFSVRPLSVEAAIAQALDTQADWITATLFARRHGLDEGVYTDRSRALLRPRDVGTDGSVTGFAQDLDDIGGRLSWYGLPFAWLLRITIGHLFGEDLRLGRPDEVATGERVDWWTIVVREDEALVLRSYDWFCGEAWLGFRVAPTGSPAIEQVGALRTKGVIGMAYWWLLWPIHQFAFRAMVSHRRARVRRGARSLRRRR